MGLYSDGRHFVSFSELLSNTERRAVSLQRPSFLYRGMQFVMCSEHCHVWWNV